MKISASEQVAAWLCALPPQTKRRVRLALRRLAKNRGDIKGLRGPLEGFSRLRVGGNRILFRQISPGNSNSTTPIRAMSFTNSTSKFWPTVVEEKVEASRFSGRAMVPESVPAVPPVES